MCLPYGILELNRKENMKPKTTLTDKSDLGYTDLVVGCIIDLLAAVGGATVLGFAVGYFWGLFV